MWTIENYLSLAAVLAVLGVPIVIAFNSQANRLTKLETQQKADTEAHAEAIRSLQLAATQDRLAAAAAFNEVRTMFSEIRDRLAFMEGRQGSQRRTDRST